LSATRILVADLPRFAREIVAELLRGQTTDVEVVEGRGIATAQEEARTRGAHVVILGRDDPAAARELLEAHPRLLVLTVAGHELVAWRYALTPRRERLGELSPAVLATGIRRPEPHAAWWTD
jgi:hypothetical protein